MKHKRQQWTVTLDSPRMKRRNGRLAASCRTVRPSPFGRVTSAPHANNSRTTCKWPLTTAQWIGLQTRHTRNYWTTSHHETTRIAAYQLGPGTYTAITLIRHQNQLVLTPSCLYRIVTPYSKRLCIMRDTLRRYINQKEMKKELGTLTMLLCVYAERTRMRSVIIKTRCGWFDEPFH